MHFHARPISFKPPRLKGLSARLTGQPLREQLRRRGPPAERDPSTISAATIRPTLPGFRLNGLKREELIATNSMLLHEVYFDSLGEGGGGDPDRSAGRGDRARLRLARPLARRVRRHGQGAGRRLGLGGADPLAARRHVSATSGRPTTRTAWPAARRSWRSTCTSTPITSTSAAMPAGYVDAFMANIAWARVAARFAGAAFAGQAAHGRRADRARHARGRSRPAGDRRAPRRRRDRRCRSACAARGARRRKRSTRSRRRCRPAPRSLVYCAWGFEIGGDCAAKLRERGIDAVAIAGGIGTWRANGLPTEPLKEGEAEAHEMGHPRTSQDRPHRLPMADHALHRQGSRSSSTCPPTRC